MSWCQCPVWALPPALSYFRISLRMPVLQLTQKHFLNVSAVSRWAFTKQGGYLGSTFALERTFTTYLEALDDRFPLLMGQASDPRFGVMHTWELSLDALAVQHRAQARPLLRILPCFAPSAEITFALLDLQVLGDELGMADTSVRSGLEALLSVGLLGLGATPGPNEIPSVVVHPLVAAASTQHLDVDVTAAASRAVRVATGRLRPDDPDDWPIWLRLLPHVRSLLCLPPAALDDRGLSAIAWAVLSLVRH